MYSASGEDRFFLMICKNGLCHLFSILSFGSKSVTNQKKGTSLLSLFFFSEPFMLNSSILDEVVAMTGYISFWNSNRRVIPNQIGTNFFQDELSSFTANLLSVSCANLRYGSQQFSSQSINRIDQIISQQCLFFPLNLLG